MSVIHRGKLVRTITVFLILFATLATTAARADIILDWRNDVGVTPDAIAAGLSSSMSLDGTGLFGTPVAGGDKYSVNVVNGMDLNEDQSYDHYMIIDVVNSTSATFAFESLDLKVFQKPGASRVYRASYLIDGGGESFLDTAWTATSDIGLGRGSSL